MSLAELASAALILAGAFFYLAGTVGVLRFPDVYTRLHAVTKADNLGLGFLVLGLALRTPGWAELLQLLAIWFVALLAAATVAQSLARAAREAGTEPWSDRP